MSTSRLLDLALPEAPGEAEHRALSLVNSAAGLCSGYVDHLATPATASGWLISKGLAPEGSSIEEYCSSRLSGLRAQLRILFGAAVENVRPPAEVLESINRALVHAPPSAIIAWDDRQGLHCTTPHPVTRLVEHAMAVLAADGVDLVTGPDVRELAVCEAPGCDRFMLRTHARRRWCSNRCGDRVRAARAYARRAGKTADVSI